MAKRSGQKRGDEFLEMMPILEADLHVLGIGYLLQSARHHLFEISRVGYAVSSCKRESQFLIEADYDKGRLEHASRSNGQHVASKAANWLARYGLLHLFIAPRSAEKFSVRRARFTQVRRRSCNPP